MCKIQASDMCKENLWENDELTGKKYVSRYKKYKNK